MIMMASKHDAALGFLFFAMWLRLLQPVHHFTIALSHTPHIFCKIHENLPSVNNPLRMHQEELGGSPFWGLWYLLYCIYVYDLSLRSSEWFFHATSPTCLQPRDLVWQESCLQVSPLNASQNPITIGMLLQLNLVIFVKQSGFFGQFVADGVHLLAKHYYSFWRKGLVSRPDWMWLDEDECRYLSFTLCWFRFFVPVGHCRPL